VANVHLWSREGNEEALSAFNRAIELDPKLHVAYLSRGHLQRQKGDVDAALADYSKAIAAHPGDPECYLARHQAYRDKGNSEAALKDVSRAIGLVPQFGMPLAIRGYFRYDAGAWKESLADFRRSNDLLLPPQQRDYVVMRIYLLRSRMGEGKQAVPDLEEYLEKRAPQPDPDWPRTILRFLAGSLKEDEFLKEAVSPEQKCEAFFYAGTQRLIAGDKKGAEEQFTACLATNVKDYTEIASAAAELATLKQR